MVSAGGLGWSGGFGPQATILAGRSPGEPHARELILLGAWGGPAPPRPAVVARALSGQFERVCYCKYADLVRRALAASATRLRENAALAVSVRRRRREEASPRSVRSLAAPEFPVRARLRLVERDDLAVEQSIAGGRHGDFLPRHHETVAFAAAPFAGGIAQRAARYPGIMGKRLRCKGEEGKDRDQPCKHSGHGRIPSVVPARRSSGRAAHPSLCNRLARSRRWGASSNAASRAWRCFAVHGATRAAGTIMGRLCALPNKICAWTLQHFASA